MSLPGLDVYPEESWIDLLSSSRIQESPDERKEEEGVDMEQTSPAPEDDGPGAAVPGQHARPPHDQGGARAPL